MKQLIGIIITLVISCYATADLTADLSNSNRADADKARDAGRKPAEVLNFLGVESGMTVIDLIAASGYYTEVLSLAVGQKGTVYAQNPAFVLEMRDGANNDALSQRLADNRLPNVIRWDRESNDLGIEANSIDVAFTALNFHDIYNRGGKEAAVGYAQLILSILKPGGVFGVVDHEGSPDGDNNSLHRMQGGLALEALLEAGFTIDATSSILRNPDDDLSKFVFDPEIRGKTDRFVIKAVKRR